MATITEVCATLHVSRHTLGKWCEKLGITAVQNDLDGRFWELTDDQVETIRQTLARRPGARPAIPYVRPASYVRGPIVPTPPARRPVDPLSASQEPSGVLIGQQVHVVRPPRVANAEQARLAANPLPPGWLPMRKWCEEHGRLHPLSVKRSVTGGWPRIPLPESRPEGEGWGSFSPQKGRYYEVEQAFRDDQVAEACRAAAERWPDRYHPCTDPACPCDK